MWTGQSRDHVRSGFSRVTGIGEAKPTARRSRAADRSGERHVWSIGVRVSAAAGGLTPACKNAAPPSISVRWTSSETNVNWLATQRHELRCPHSLIVFVALLEMPQGRALSGIAPGAIRSRLKGPREVGSKAEGSDAEKRSRVPTANGGLSLSDTVEVFGNDHWKSLHGLPARKPVFASDRGALGDAGTLLSARRQAPRFCVKAAGMSCYSVAEEITSICADFLVERRGFKLMVIVA
jgi:hypothetical protein